MKKTLGGQRLGSGNNMQVDLHSFERSTHDLSYIWRSTMSSGTLVPFMCELALPGDTIDIHLNCFMMSLPTIGPLFGSYKVQLDVFKVPVRLYNSAIHNNYTDIGLRMQNIKLPKVRLFADETTSWDDLDNSQVNPSCIFSYLGIRGVASIGTGLGIQSRLFNAVPWLGYWDIYKQYYSNKQEEEGVVIRKTIPGRVTPTFVQVTTILGAVAIPGAPTVGTVFAGANSVFRIDGIGVDVRGIVFNTSKGRINASAIGFDYNFISPIPAWQFTFDHNRYGDLVIENWDLANADDITNLGIDLYRFPLSDIDDMRMAILQEPPFSEFIVNTPELDPYKQAVRSLTFGADNLITMKSSQEGLGIKTYQSDLFNNWLSTEWIDGTGGINEITAVDTSSGSFNIDALILSRKVYEMLNRIAVSGGTYNDWINAVYDHDQYMGEESPVYVGGLIKEFVFQEVISNSESQGTNGSQPLGTLAGRGILGDKHKGGDIIVRCGEPCYIMGIISLTPRLDYSQGNKWDVNLKTWNDFHKPNLDQIGFQELITEQMAWWSTDKPTGADAFTQRSAGKQPAWVNYMTNVNKVYGNFARENDSMFMVLNRKYSPNRGSFSTVPILDLTTYVDPAKFNSVFAQTSLDSQNFWAQISVDITARRKMSAKVMPNL